MRNRICFVVVWFGDLPAWLGFFLKSCTGSDGIDWQIFTDAVIPTTCPSNVFFRRLSKGDFEQIVSERINEPYSFSYGYKLCDLKPAYGHFFQDWLKGYDYWGYCDLDIVLGNPLQLLQEVVAINADVITASTRILVGHFTLLKNTHRFRMLYQDCPAWREKFFDKDYRVFDEADFSDYVQKLGAESTLLLAEVPIVQEDTLVFWSGRRNFIVLWREGRLFDVLAFRELGYFHFIKTKYCKSIVKSDNADTAAVFVLTRAGFKSITTNLDWCWLLILLVFELFRTVPWYVRRLCGSILPASLKGRIRRLIPHQAQR